MNLSDIFRKAALSLPFLGVVLVAYPTASPRGADPGQIGAQNVDKGRANGAVTYARCHGFDGAADGECKNALTKPIAEGLSEAEGKTFEQYCATAPANCFLAPRSSPGIIPGGEQWRRPSKTDPTSQGLRRTAR